MSLVIMTMVWRLWLVGTVLLFLNGLSSWLFKPNKRNLYAFIKAIPFIAVWPLAVFSPNGRKIIFKRIKGA